MINLDDYSTDPDELVGLCRHFLALSQYCQIKGGAMRARAAGEITAALALEMQCESIYRELPEDLRW